MLVRSKINWERIPMTEKEANQWQYKYQNTQKSLGKWFKIMKFHIHLKSTFRVQRNWIQNGFNNCLLEVYFKDA